LNEKGGENHKTENKETKEQTVDAQKKKKKSKQSKKGQTKFLHRSLKQATLFCYCDLSVCEQQ